MSDVPALLDGAVLPLCSFAGHVSKCCVHLDTPVTKLQRLDFVLIGEEPGRRMFAQVTVRNTEDGRTYTTAGGGTLEFDAGQAVTVARPLHHNGLERLWPTERTFQQGRVVRAPGMVM